MYMSLNTDGEVDSKDYSIVDLPLNTTVFEAEGVKYYVEDFIAVGRYKAYQKMEMELGFTINFSGLAGNLVSAFSALNERRDADAAVILKQIMDGVTLYQEKKPIALYVATLFINTEKEDRSEWSLKEAEIKIDHWKNINANFFLGLALGRVRDFPAKYNQIAQMLSRVSEVRERMENLTEDSNSDGEN